MEELLIGLFLSLLARFIKNPQKAVQYRDQLEHIYNGIGAILAVINAPEVPKS